MEVVSDGDKPCQHISDVRIAKLCEYILPYMKSPIFKKIRLFFNS